MKGSQAAGRYAQSLIDLAVERNELEAVKTDMENVAKICAESHELDLLLHSPIIKTDQKLKALTSIFSGSVCKLSMDFIALLTRKGREGLIVLVANAFAALYRELKGIVIVEVTSASKLSAEQIKEIEQKLSGLGQSIEIIQKVDTNVLGGLKMKVGDQRIDATLRRKLNELKHETHKS